MTRIEHCHSFVLGAGSVKQPLVCYAKILHRFDNDVSTRQAKQCLWDAPGLWTGQTDGRTNSSSSHSLDYYAMLSQVCQDYQGTQDIPVSAVPSPSVSRVMYLAALYLRTQSRGAVTDGGPFLVCQCMNLTWALGPSPRGPSPTHWHHPPAPVHQ